MISLIYSIDKVREKSTKITNLSSAGCVATSSSKVTTKKKIPKSNRGKDSGTSSEEERWLDAIESGKLEEVCMDINVVIFIFNIVLNEMLKKILNPLIYR